MIAKDQLIDLLVRARKVITDGVGWQDDEASYELILEIDEAFGGRVPTEGRGAYDEDGR